MHSIWSYIVLLYRTALDVAKGSLETLVYRTTQHQNDCEDLSDIVRTTMMFRSAPVTRASVLALPTMNNEVEWHASRSPLPSIGRFSKQFSRSENAQSSPSFSISACYAS
jgi:hypothetical protein